MTVVVNLALFQSSVRINVGPNLVAAATNRPDLLVSILRED